MGRGGRGGMGLFARGMVEGPVIFARRGGVGSTAIGRGGFGAVALASCAALAFSLPRFNFEIMRCKRPVPLGFESLCSGGPLARKSAKSFPPRPCGGSGGPSARKSIKSRVWDDTPPTLFGDMGVLG